LNKIYLFLISLLAFAASQSDSNSKPEFDSFHSVQSESLSVEYIAHASFILQYKGTKILLDPFADKEWIGYSFPKDITADAIFSTHPHYDHDGGLFLDREPYWKDKIPLHQDPGKYSIGSFEITGLKGKHSDPYGKEFGQKNTIWLIDAGETRILHWGDNGPANDDLIEKFGEVDILMIPIDSTYHILKKEETEAMITAIDPNIIIPMHYKHPDLEDEPDQPKNLGPITPVLENKENVTWLTSHKYQFEGKPQPDRQTYIVFKHSPDIEK